MILFFLVGSSRWFLKMYFGKYVLGYLPKRVRKGIVIYGTGESGRQLASSLVHSSEFKLLFFISDKESFGVGL